MYCHLNFKLNLFYLSLMIKSKYSPYFIIEVENEGFEPSSHKFPINLIRYDTVLIS
nr:MAG TPA_asm: hypothetical protein [Caudoviricetes sp.]